MRFSTDELSSDEDLEPKYGHRGRRLMSIDSDSESEAESDDTDETAALTTQVSMSGLASAKNNVSLYSDVDSWERRMQQARQRVWLTASHNHALSLSNLHSKDDLLLSNAQSTKQLKRQREMEEIASLLNDLDLARQKQTKQLQQAFDTRNAELWASIEKVMQAKEREEAELKAAKEKQLAAELKARQDRERQAALLQEEESKKAEKARKEQAEEEAAQQRSMAEKKAQEQAAKTSAAAQDTLQAKNWTRWHGEMDQIKKDVLPMIAENPAWKKICREAKRVITPKIGQVTNSVSHITQISTQISNVLNTLQSNASQTYIWGLNHLSKALIRQAETEITARLEVAFPLSRLVNSLIHQFNHTQLASVLMARLVKKCFWITGHYPARSAFSDDVAHKKALGHDVKSGHEESLMGYAQRMTGIVSLYSALVVTSTTVPSAPIQFQPVSLWTLLVSLFNLPLSALEPIPQMIETILFIAGRTLLTQFGKQWTKLWHALLDQGIRARQLQVCGKDAGWVKASVVKLTLLLEDWQTKGIKEVDGSQPEP